MGFEGTDKNNISYTAGQLRNAPIWSAAYRRARPLKTFLTIFVLTGIFTVFITRPEQTVATGALIMTAVIIVLASLRLLGCVLALRRRPIALPDPDIWPFYTVLVPMRDEAHMVETLMNGLARLDYPASRLEIMMISEANDPPTTAAVLAHLRPPFKSVVVPVSLPATKPKALNVAMMQAKGEIVTIYDAEDRPHSGQLKNAARALGADKNLAAVQAPLSYYNSDQNWLTRQFTLEYDGLFKIWNPLLTAIGLPFPLGGTSNHIKRRALDECGWWDPHNVTEDADLSFRLAAYGYRIGCIDLPTGEEALSDYDNWKKQRMRWQKGYIQTWDVHMRKTKGLGVRRFTGLQITLAATLLTSLLHPIAIIGLCAVLCLSAAGLMTPPPSGFYFVMAYGYACALAVAATGAYLSGRTFLWKSLVFTPVYWLLLLSPTVLAAIEFFTAPFHWHKSKHGRAKIDEDADKEIILHIDERAAPRHVSGHGQNY